MSTKMMTFSSLAALALSVSLLTACGSESKEPTGFAPKTTQSSTASQSTKDSTSKQSATPKSSSSSSSKSASTSSTPSQKPSTSPAASSAPVASSQATSSSTAVASSSATASSSQTTTTESSATSQASQTSQSSQASSTPSATSSVDPQAIANGDYSSLAGTWTNDLGRSFTFDANGLVSSEKDGQIYTDYYVAHPYLVRGTDAVSMYLSWEGTQGGAYLMVFPANSTVAGPIGEREMLEFGEPDSRDHIQIGQDYRTSNQHRYYRN